MEAPVELLEKPLLSSKPDARQNDKPLEARKESIGSSLKID